jgi:phenylacetate-CoA ligase
MLVTVPFSRPLPLIRYELSDSVRPATSPYCPCGRPFALIDGVQRRVEDMLRFPYVSGGQVTVQAALFHRVMDTVPVGGWQVVQEPSGVTVLLSGVQKGYADAALADSIRRELAAQGALVPSVEVRRVSASPRTSAGKALLIMASRT